MILTFEERMANAVKEMANGTFRGATRAASPFQPPLGGFNGTHQSLTDVRPAPFIVVASDGTGDFLDPKAAIDSIAAGAPTVIFVKNTGVNYSTGGVDLTGKIITLWGESSVMRFPATTTTGPYWTLGVSSFTTSSATRFHVKGMAIDSSGTSFGLATGAQLFLDQASIGGGGNQLAMNAGIVVAYGSSFALHSTSYTGSINAWDCQIVMPNATMTLTTDDLIWRGCSISPGGGSTHVTLAYNSPSSGAQLSITDCDFGEFSELILSGWNQATFKGNSNHTATPGGTQGARLSTLTCTGNDRLVVDSTMHGTTLVVNATQRFNLGGVWGRTGSTIAADGGSMCVTFDGDNSVGGFPTATLLTISGDHNVGSVHANGSTTNGVLVSGDFNVLSVTGTNNAGNLVNLTGNSNKITTEVGATTADTGAANVFL